MKRVTARFVWLGMATVILVIIAANAHLAYVAFASQPACVVHSKVGENLSGSDFSAANSSC